MKKISVLTLAALLPICGAIAGPGKTNNMNTQQNQPTIWLVTDIIDLPDNTPVVLRGRITKNMGNEIFIFEDNSGTIMLEVDETDWNGNTVTVDDIVTVYGNLDKNDTYTEVDVTSIQK